MSAQSPVTQDPGAAAPHAHRFAFFRQSGWLMITTLGAGMLMFLLHKAAGKMPGGEYAVFTTLLQIVTLMGIPTVGLQTIFTHQAAAALHDHHERELAAVLRGVLRGTVVIWLMIAATIFVFRHSILTGLKIVNPEALWVTDGIRLLAMWMPVFMGLLQGRQNFLWLGWANVFNAIARFGGICLIVLVFGGQSGGAMTAVLVGMAVVIGIAAWQLRDVLMQPAMKLGWSHWREWLMRIVPLTLGLGTVTFMLSADMVFVQRFFETDTKFYAAAGMIGRALVFFTQPLAAVMFPKLVRSAARSEKTNVLALALGVTALAGGGAAIACTVMPSLPLRIVYDQTYLDISTPLVPWFAWAMLPLTLSMVLVNALLARSRFDAVPWLVLVAVGYGVTLYFKHDSFFQVISVLGIFSTLLLAVSAWFTWVKKAPETAK